MHIATLMAMDDLDTPGGRLRYLRLRANIPTTTELAGKVRLPPSTVYGHERNARGITPPRSRVYAQKLKRWPETVQLVASWLLMGGQLNQIAGNTALLTNDSLEPDRVPILECSDMAQFSAIVAGAIPMSENELFAPKGLGAGGRTFVVEAIDKSMESSERNNIYKGEHVFIDPDADYETDNVVAAMVPGFDTLIFRKFRVTSIDGDGNQFFDLIALNPDHPSIPNAHTRNAQIVGRVIGAMRVFD